MALTNFIPAVWAGLLLANLNKSLVYGSLVNRDYEGEIARMGDSVKINSIGRVTVFDYVKNTNMADPETLNDSQQTLLINQSKAFNFQIDDIDAAQQNPKVMAEATAEGGYALADVNDRFIASLYTGAQAANLIGSDASPTSIVTPADAYLFLVRLKVKLDEADIPQTGRWVVVPAWFHGLLLQDSRFVAVGSMASDAVLRNGQVGMAAGFDISMSNNVPNTAQARYKIIAGYPGAISYAAQIVEVEGYRPEKRFADALKGLNVYGAKLVRPGGIAVLTANPT
ncbi:MAG: P22 coat protein - protein 5 domain protein [Armatimonadetes bacterium]|nr:P22 coat protein - protein 5 domain protein [Armatimonadota bacterium]